MASTLQAASRSLPVRTVFACLLALSVPAVSLQALSCEGVKFASYDAIAQGQVIILQNDEFSDEVFAGLAKRRWYLMKDRAIVQRLRVEYLRDHGPYLILRPKRSIPPGEYWLDYDRENACREKWGAVCRSETLYAGVGINAGSGNFPGAERGAWGVQKIAGNFSMDGVDSYLYLRPGGLSKDAVILIEIEEDGVHKTATALNPGFSRMIEGAFVLHGGVCEGQSEFIHGHNYHLIVRELDRKLRIRPLLDVVFKMPALPSLTNEETDLVNRAGELRKRSFRGNLSEAERADAKAALAALAVQTAPLGERMKKIYETGVRFDYSPSDLQLRSSGQSASN